MSLFVFFIIELNVQLFTSQVSKDQLWVSGFSPVCVYLHLDAFFHSHTCIIKDQMTK